MPAGRSRAGELPRIRNISSSLRILAASRAVGGYSPQTLDDADIDWRTALAGGGHWKLTSDDARDGASRNLALRQITFRP